MSAGGFVAVLVIDLHFPDAGSLKGKRKELASIKAQLRTRLGVAVAEIEHQDLWQRARLTAALTGGSSATLAAASDNVERWLDARWPEGVSVERLLVSLDDLRDLDGPGLRPRDLGAPEPASRSGLIPRFSVDG